METEEERLATLLAARREGLITEDEFAAKVAAIAAAPGQGSAVLPAGSFRMVWEAEAPFATDEFGAVCGVTADLFTASGESADGRPGVLETLDAPRSGSRYYTGIPAGAYTVWAPLDHLTHQPATAG